MPVREYVAFLGSRRSLVGIVTDPEHFDPARPAVLLLSPARLLRCGANRLYVKLARQLADAGLLTLRFDFSGTGDSLPRQDDVPKNQANILEAVEAMDYLQAEYGVRQFLAIGLCQGAWTAFHAAVRDARVVGLGLINPDTLSQNRNSAALRNVQSRPVLQSLKQPSSWIRLILGRADYRNKFAMMRTLVRDRLSPRRLSAEIDEVTARLRALDARGVSVLVAMADDDPSRVYMKPILNKVSVSEEIVPSGEHMFTPLASQRLLLDAIERWARGPRKLR